MERFQGKSKDPSAVQVHIEQYLKNDGFTVQTSSPSNEGVVIQAKKDHFLLGGIHHDGARTVTITGSSDDFTVLIGIGKWVEHLGVAAIETLPISDLFLAVKVAETTWNVEIEDTLLKDLRAFVG